MRQIFPYQYFILSPLLDSTAHAKQIWQYWMASTNQVAVIEMNVDAKGYSSLKVLQTFSVGCLILNLQQ